MAETKIEWCDVVCNPLPGCRKVSPGCLNCYAEPMAKRLKGMGKSAYQDVVDEHGWTGKVGRNPEAMHVPGMGKRVFVQSMGDLFYERISDEDRDWCFGRMLAQPQHDFLVLTKRIERAAGYYQGCIENPDDFDGLPSPIVHAPNIWLGVTVCNQDEERKILTLLEIPAAVRFVSLEPLLGPFGFTPWFLFGPSAGNRTKQVDWVIVGCERGPRRRPCDNNWVRGIVDQCHMAGVPVFIKQIEIKGEVEKNPERIVRWLGGKVEDIRQWPHLKPLLRALLPDPQSTSVRQEHAEDLAGQLAVVTAQRDNLAKDLAAAQLNMEAYKKQVKEVEQAIGKKEGIERHDVSKDRIETDKKPKRTCETCVRRSPSLICRNERSGSKFGLQVGAANGCDGHLARPRTNHPTTSSHGGAKEGVRENQQSEIVNHKS